MAEPLVPWLIIAPEDAPKLLSQELTPELQTQMWEHFDTYFHLDFNIVELGLVRWLLFPEQRERIKKKSDFKLLKDTLSSLIDDNSSTALVYHLALFGSLIFPGELKELVTSDLVKNTHMGNGRERLNTIGVADLLAAEQVSVDDQGEIRVERQKPGLVRKPELPARSLV
ncbi:MAG: hypothetical protein AAB558_00880 [Patescibacteria group bacterium]